TFTGASTLVGGLTMTASTIVPTVTIPVTGEVTEEVQITTVTPVESSTKRQNGYGDELVTPTGSKPTQKPNGEKDVPVVPAKVASRHALFFSGYDKDRSPRLRRGSPAQNGYGDEPVTPGLDPYVDQDEEEGTTTQATTTTTVPPTTTKAQNGYGDEQVVPEVTDVPYAPQPEQEYAPVDPYAPPTPAVTAGGYKRLRRDSHQNGYGDEAVTPADDGYGSAVTEGTQDEYAPATVPQSGYGEETVQQSGYNRKKRANEYGDEQVTPSTDGKGSDYAPAPEQPYGVQDQYEVTDLPQQTSGY
ncbi:hypothetical protein PFISCL1PPCAC_15136, partial [Pristionchus fissidentatus]